MESKAVVSLTNGKKAFGDNEVLKDISLTVNAGDVLAIIGPSGGGKSTLLRCMTLLETLDSGDLSYGDLTVCANNAEGRAVYGGKDVVAAAKTRFGLVFQNFNLFPHYTVLQNVTDALICVQKMPKDEALARGRELLARMGLADKEAMVPCDLSGGQQQRVALARALVIKPDVLLMDEPLSNLDAKLRVEMRTVIKEIQHTVGITNVYVTHDQEEAMAVSDRIAVINKGDIQQVGTPKDIYQRPANLFVATFIGRSNVLDGELRMENGKPVLHFHAGASITLDNVRAEECKNQPVKISVRPEEFILDASTDATGLKATVDSSVFLGLNTHYFAHTDDGDKIEIIQESQIDSIIPDGTVVRLGVKTEKINVFDAEGKQNLLEGVRNDNAV